MRREESGLGRGVIDLDALARYGTTNARDIEIVHRTDSVDEAYEWIVRQLAEKALGRLRRRCSEAEGAASGKWL